MGTYILKISAKYVIIYKNVFIVTKNINNRITGFANQFAGRLIRQEEDKMQENVVKGFLDVDGKRIINEDGETVLLKGWGLGNWLLCEGYMWKSMGSERFDRPRRIETVIEELAGTEYAKDFWKRFRDNYITEEDIRRMKELGYNSVRIPINSRLFLEEGMGLNWVEEGFLLLDRVIDWCEKYSLYAFIDLHGAPGGQTGANIDDSIDDIPRLFVDEDCFQKGLQLWKRLAERYADRSIVGGYDLLNEPIRPKRHEKDTDLEYLLPRLCEFYEKAIEEIRKVDQKHLISIEGHHWATACEVFYKKYDPKMIIHFHRYACIPDVSSYREYLELAQKWDVPLWLGESGENIIEWFTAMYPLAEKLGIGYNIWPWKKMDCQNSPCSIPMPKDWEMIINYTTGGKHPGYEKAREILEEYLHNMLLENCVFKEEVSASVLREPGSVIRGTDFDEFPGRGISFSGLRGEDNIYSYRLGTGMLVKEKYKNYKKKFGFDCGFVRFVLELAKDEHACYSLNNTKEKDSFTVSYYCSEAAAFEILQDGEKLSAIECEPGEELKVTGLLALKEKESTVLTVKVVKGIIELEAIHSYRGESK